MTIENKILSACPVFQGNVHSSNVHCLSKREIWKLSRGKQFIYSLSTMNVTRQDKVVQSIISTNDWLVRSSMFHTVISVLVSYQCVLSFSLSFCPVKYYAGLRNVSLCILHYSVTVNIVLIPLQVNIIALNQCTGRECLIRTRLIRSFFEIFARFLSFHV